MQKIPEKPQLLTSDEADEFLGFGKNCLATARSKKDPRLNVPFYQLGGRVRYDVRDLIEFLESRKVTA